MEKTSPPALVGLKFVEAHIFVSLERIAFIELDVARNNPEDFKNLLGQQVALLELVIAQYALALETFEQEAELFQAHRPANYPAYIQLQKKQKELLRDGLKAFLQC